MYAFAKPADFEFPHEKILLKVSRWDDIGSLEGQLVNSRPPEIAIYLRTYLRASFIAMACTACARVSRWSSVNKPSCNWTRSCLDSGNFQ